MKSKLQNISFRRKREGKTDYYKRLKLLRSGKPRLVVRPSLKNISVQAVDYNQKGDKIIKGITSSVLEKYGWRINRGNIPAAYLTGYLAGMTMLKNGIKYAILDTGLRKPIKGGRIYACVKGVIDSGVTIPVDEGMLPEEDRTKGEHIADYSKIKKNEWHCYKKSGVDPKEIKKLFETVKKNIESKV